MGRLTQVAAAIALLAGCEDGSYRSIGGDVRLLADDGRGEQAEPAMARLQAFGRPAIPQIEIALHTATDRGRARLIEALARMGDEESIPILRHHAVYDASADVREACERALGAWAAGSDARGEKARAALQDVRGKRARGEAPVAAWPGQR